MASINLPTEGETGWASKLNTSLTNINTDLIAVVSATAGKLDASTSVTTVYSVNGSGQQAQLPYASTATAQTIMYRTTGGVTFVGTPTATGHATTKAYVDAADALTAPLISPAFSGTPTAPTATSGTNTLQIATTAFVTAAIAAAGGGGGGTAGVTSVNGRAGVVTLTSSDVGLGNVDNTADSAKPVSTAQAASIATKQAASASLTNLSTLATTGNLTQTGTDTYVNRTLTAGTNITITNGDGVSGNPTVTVSGTISVARGGTGRASKTAYALLAGGTTTTGSEQSLTTGTAGQLLKSGGASALPSWSDPAPSLVQGTYAARPTAAAGVGTTYWATDLYEMYFSTGTTWITLPSSGVSLGYADTDPNQPMFNTSATTPQNLPGLTMNVMYGTRGINVEWGGHMCQSVAGQKCMVTVYVDDVAYKTFECVGIVADTWNWETGSVRIIGGTPGTSHTIKLMFHSTSGASVARMAGGTFIKAVSQ